MTPQEAKLLLEVRPELQFHVWADPNFVYLKGKPCPLLAYDRHHKALCTEYERRPYNCRRFGCFRPDPSKEPYEAEPVDLERLRLGCANLSDRLRDRKVRKEYARLQKKAQRWALKHGWSEQTAPAPHGSSVVVYGLRRTLPRPEPL